MSTSKKNSSKESLFRLPRLLIILLSIAGFAIMVYLTYIHYDQAKSVCDISEKVSCNAVTTSIYSEIFGIPISVLGLGYFGLTLLMAIWYRTRAFYQTLFFLTLFVLVPSYYFTVLEATIIDAWCLFCETSKILMVLILIISFFNLRQKFSETLRMAIPVVIAGLVAAGVTFFMQSSIVANKDYTPFVKALNEAGVVYYKSYTCSNCKKQEQIIGKEAIAKLNHVECHPDGPNGNPELCLEKDIEHTPTFIIEKDGKEVKRKSGVMTVEEFAAWAGVPKEVLKK